MCRIFSVWRTTKKLCARHRVSRQAHGTRKMTFTKIREPDIPYFGPRLNDNKNGSPLSLDGFVGVRCRCSPKEGHISIFLRCCCCCCWNNKTSSILSVWDQILRAGQRQRHKGKAGSSIYSTNVHVYDETKEPFKDSVDDVWFYNDDETSLGTIERISPTIET